MKARTIAQRWTSKIGVRVGLAHRVPDRRRGQDPEDPGETFQLHARGRVEVRQQPAEGREQGGDGPVEPVDAEHHERPDGVESSPGRTRT